MNSWDIIYQYCDDHPNCASDACVKTVFIQPRTPIDVPVVNLMTTKFSFPTKRITFLSPIPWARVAGLMLLALGIGGFVGPLIPEIRLESSYLVSQLRRQVGQSQATAKPLPKSVPVVFTPLVGPDGAPITPVNKEFALIVPKIGVNAPVMGEVNPGNEKEYDKALQAGVAHASTSFFPDQDGTVYLFSHSTNYQWFVKDLNAVFYLLKNLEKGDSVVIFYKGKQYTYIISDKKVVSPRDTSYLVPMMGKRNLILQTCWPPGSTAQRLLIFANLVQDGGQQI